MAKSRPPFDTAHVERFYTQPVGQGLISRITLELEKHTLSLQKRAVIGIGHAGPILAHLRSVEPSAWYGLANLDPLVMTSSSLGRFGPHAAPTCRVEAGRLPFADLSIDVFILMHGLDEGSCPRILREIWRSLCDDGILILITPNPFGFLTHDKRTPFSRGSSFRLNALNNLLRDALFHCEWSARIAPFPLSVYAHALRPVLALETLIPGLGALTGAVNVVGAVKHLYRTVACHEAPYKKRRLSETDLSVCKCMER